MPKGKENVKYDRLRGKDKHKYEMMFAIRKALEKSNNWSEFQKKLSRDKIHFTIRTDSKGKSCGIVFSRGEYTFSGSRIDRSLSYFKIANMLIKYENNLDISDSLGNTQQDKIQEQEKDTVTPAEHEEIYENDITSPTGNSIIYNPQIQISVVSGTKRSIFRQKNKTKRSKKRLHTTLIKPEQKVNEDLCSGFIVS